ncbi:hypothetical protein, partial [Serratia marcescens]|uniref:hypothetical protein n=1 Tax=Serratia marcescens TaxID=615 RepID=UPI00281420E1
MADDVDEAFDFDSEEFSREELTETLNDMVAEYKSLAERLLKVEAENLILTKKTELPTPTTNVSSYEIRVLRKENDLLKEEN